MTSFYAPLLFIPGCSPPSGHFTSGSGSTSPTKTVYEVNDVVTFTCESPDPFIQSGTTTSTCQSDGNFSPTPAVVCSQGN